MSGEETPASDHPASVYLPPLHPCVSLCREISHAKLLLIAFPLCLQRDEAVAVPCLKTRLSAARADTGSRSVLLSRGSNAEGRCRHIFRSVVSAIARRLRVRSPVTTGLSVLSWCALACLVKTHTDAKILVCDD